MASPNLPAEILETIFLDLPHVSLLSCSKACPQFAEIINRDAFLDNYCQKLLQADWIKWEMLLKARTSCPLVLEMWYLSSISACHPNLTVKACDSLHSIGIFVYILNTWFVINKQLDPRNKELCTECHGTKFLQTVVSNSDALHLFMKLAIAVPEFIFVTLLNCQRTVFCEGKRPFNWGAAGFDFPEKQGDYYVEMVLVERESEDEYMYMLDNSDENEDLYIMSAFLALGGDSWIGWSGHVDYTYFTDLGTFSSCCVDIRSSFHDIETALKNTFGYYVHCFKTYGIAFRGWKYSVTVQHVPKEPQESLWVNFQSLLEDLAVNITKKIQRLGMQEGRRENLKRYLDRYLHKDVYHGKAQGSNTVFVAVLRYLHRVLNDIFYPECMKYMNNIDCIKYLAHSRQLKETISQVTSFVRFKGKFSIHNLPPKLWPAHLLTQAMTAAPVVSRLVQVDILLWKKGLHCQPVSNKIKHFLIEQTDSCGLSYTSCDYPPLCGLVCFSHNDSDQLNTVPVAQDTSPN